MTCAGDASLALRACRRPPASAVHRHSTAWYRPCQSLLVVTKRSLTVPGTGLPIGAHSALLALSIALFLFVGGALWKAPREASHVARFAVSYLAVVPLGALLLFAFRRLTWSHWIATVGSVWAIKMVVTVMLYQAFARGTAAELVANAPPTPGATPAHSADYRPATGRFPGESIHGRVRQGTEGVAGAIVYLDAPAPGRRIAEPSQVDLVIQGSRYDAPLYLLHTDDRARIQSRDAVLHTLHFHGPGRTPANLPLPPSAEAQAIELPDPGLVQLRCDNHPDEIAWMVVVDHPYVAISGNGGEFSLDGVPAGAARVIAVAPGPTGARRAEARVTVTEGMTVELSLDLTDLRESAR